MRDEKVCPCCGGDLVWKGNALEGAMHCAACDEAADLNEAEGDVVTGWDPAANFLTVEYLAALRSHDHSQREHFGDYNQQHARSQREFEKEYFCDQDRQSGRTHAMVLRALDTAAHGESVVILVHHSKMVYYVENMIKGLGLHKIRPDTFSVGNGTLKVVCPLHQTHSGYGLRCKVFADHACYEAGSSRFWDEFSDWRMRHEILK